MFGYIENALVILSRAFLCCLRKLDGRLSHYMFQILKLIGEFHAIKSALIVIETKSYDFKQ